MCIFIAYVCFLVTNLTAERYCEDIVCANVCHCSVIKANHVKLMPKKSVTINIFDANFKAPCLHFIGVGYFIIFISVNDYFMNL